MFIRNKFNIINFHDQFISNCKALNIVYEFNNTFYYCTGIYRSPSINQMNFITSLQFYLDNFDNNGIHNIIGCDISIDINNNYINSLNYFKLLAHYEVLILTCNCSL